LYVVPGFLPAKLTIVLPAVPITNSHIPPVPSFDQISYPVIAEPPSLAGAVHEIETVD
jgi:hypothetical protein